MVALNRKRASQKERAAVHYSPRDSETFSLGGTVILLSLIKGLRVDSHDSCFSVDNLHQGVAHGDLTCVGYKCKWKGEVGKIDDGIGGEFDLEFFECFVSFYRPSELAPWRVCFEEGCDRLSNV